jgi:hypothetical protein
MQSEIQSKPNQKVFFFFLNGQWTKLYKLFKFYFIKIVLGFSSPFQLKLKLIIKSDIHSIQALIELIRPFKLYQFILSHLIFSITTNFSSIESLMCLLNN